MRISTSFRFDNYVQNINDAQSRIAEAEQQVSTGKKVTKSSDDPYAVKRILTMRSLQTTLGQYSDNLNNAKTWLSFSEQSLTDIGTILTSAKLNAQRGATSTSDQNARNTMAQEVSDMQSRLVAIGNTQGPNGQYIFAGQKTDKAPFTATAGVITYIGDTNNVIAETSASTTMNINSPAKLITDTYNALEQVRQNLLNGNMTSLSDVDMTTLSTVSQSILQERGAVGSRLTAITDLTAQNQRRTDELTSNISDLEDSNAATAMTNYQQAYTAYQAALSLATQGNKLSLLDYIS